MWFLLQLQSPNSRHFVMDYRVPLSDPFGRIAFAAAILAIIASIGLFAQLYWRRLPGNAQILMLAAAACNLVWHSIGIYRTFIDYSQPLSFVWHFWIGCFITLFDFVAQLEILRVFECITNFRATNVTKWEIGTLFFFIFLAFGSILEHVGVTIPFVIVWSKMWLMVWFAYVFFTTIWIKIFLTMRLYQSMRLQRGMKLKGSVQDFSNDYLRLLGEHITLFVIQIFTGLPWSIGWLGNYDTNTSLCYLKLGEAHCTFHLLMTSYFLHRIRQFRFGTQKEHPTKIGVIVESMRTKPMDTFILTSHGKSMPEVISE
jgi:hypothetical protein